jgi:hypothetical protein
MNIRHQGEAYHSGKLSQRLGGFGIRNGKAEEAATHLFKPPYPGSHGFPGFSLQIRKAKAVFPHGLNDHRMTAPHIDRLYLIKAADL